MASVVRGDDDEANSEAPVNNNNNKQDNNGDNRLIGYIDNKALNDAILKSVAANANLKKELEEVRLKAEEALKVHNAKLAGGLANRGGGNGGPKLGAGVEDISFVNDIVKTTTSLVDSCKSLADSIGRAFG